MFEHLIPVVPFSNKVFVRGSGSYLYDNHNRAYLDLNSGQFCTVLGHANTEIVENLYSSMLRLSHTSTTLLSDSVIEASLLLNTISGDMKACSILLSTGAEAVEFCLRYAKYIKGKRGIACLDVGYHGLTLGAQSVTFGGKHAYPNISDVYTIPTPTISSVEESLDVSPLLKIAEEILSENQHTIAALILEPIISVGGMIIPPKAWLTGLRDICKKYDIFMILDECQTGFGRTGNWFAYQTYEIIPDMVVTSKAIGLGFPVSVCMFNSNTIDYTKLSHKTHYSSHQNDPFSASIIISGINYINKYNLLPKIKERGIYFLYKLLSLQSRLKNKVNFARGIGLMLGLDLMLGANCADRYKEFSSRMLEEGVIIQGTKQGSVLRFLPDYLITNDSIDLAMDKMEYVLNNMEESHEIL